MPHKTAGIIRSVRSRHDTIRHPCALLVLARTALNGAHGSSIADCIPNPRLRYPGLWLSFLHSEPQRGTGASNCGNPV